MQLNLSFMMFFNSRILEFRSLLSKSRQTPDSMEQVSDLVMESVLWVFCFPGEKGIGVLVDPKLLPPRERKKYEEGWFRHAFNQFISDRISVRRYLTDVREGLCRTQKFPANQPATAVVICFHNECWSTLLRSVHSVLDTVPENLLKEIVLVDDFSTYEYLKSPLDRYMKQLKKVKVIHTDKREGLIRARMIGMNASTAEILTFLDSHIECNKGEFFKSSSKFAFLANSFGTMLLSEVLKRETQ
ncbi:hypothetical protein T265_04699 [Opisthorchis viverrini]|uniref:Glycosyltransferase 2-like domain-containing protein n=1 Tax=Opisthorchis viverrini TaxID=6198 RepID=A0A074ZMV6_OPIVI|nr:hypothetical protein T265_04699 [Opisthorchis viverrini]KER28471.1 hypothetical protein T265_04699 [Opisthorchis viverrini]